MQNISNNQQKYYTKICKYCKGTGTDPLNRNEDCPNCIKPYQNTKFINLTEEDKDQLLMEEVNLGIQ